MTMHEEQPFGESIDDVVGEIAASLADGGLRVAAVESLTSGAVASALGRGEGASEWFGGAVVAYQTATKQRVLDLAPGTDPCSPSCARQLAAGGRRLLAADVCVSVTGVGGPDPEDGHSPGEVHLGIATRSGVRTEAHLFGGSPADVVEQSVRAALRLLRAALGDTSSGAADTDSEGVDVDDVRIDPLRPEDAGEVLTVQRAAFVSEAQIYGSADSGPLTQTLDQLEAEIAAGGGWAARIRGRLVGAIRTREADDVLLVGRIAIAPDIQGVGIGRRLLSAAEDASGADEAELFTGSLSEANLRLYRELGYTESERVDQGDGTAQVFMRKRLRA